jgi:hypothetical protein
MDVDLEQAGMNTAHFTCDVLYTCTEDWVEIGERATNQIGGSGGQ